MGAGWPRGGVFPVLSLADPRRGYALRPRRRLLQALAGQRHVHYARPAAPRAASVSAQPAVLPGHAVARALSGELSADCLLYGLHGPYRLMSLTSSSNAVLTSD